MYLNSKFNQPITNLPPNLTHLTFGKYFNQSLDYLPNNIKELKLGTNSIKNCVIFLLP